MGVKARRGDRGKKESSPYALNVTVADAEPHPSLGSGCRRSSKTRATDTFHLNLTTLTTNPRRINHGRRKRNCKGAPKARKVCRRWKLLRGSSDVPHRCQSVSAPSLPHRHLGERHSSQGRAGQVRTRKRRERTNFSGAISRKT